MKKIIAILCASLLIRGVRSQSLEKAVSDIYYERYENAKAALIPITLSSNPNPDAFYMLGEIYLQQGKLDSAYKMYSSEAAPFLQREFNKKESPLVYIGWAHVLLDSGKITESKALLEKILERTKYKNAAALLAAATANIKSKNGDINRAIELLNMAVKRDKKNPALYNALGDAYRKMTDGSNAVRNYDMALELDTENAAAMYKKGKIYKTQNNEEIYLDRFMKAYNLDSNYTPVLYELYQYYFSRDVVNAQRYLDKYIANADPDPQQAYMKADLLYASRKFDDAIRLAGNILKTEGDTAQARLYKLIAYSNAGLGDSASALKNMNLYFSKQDTAGYVAKDFAMMARLLETANPADTSQVVDLYQKALLTETDAKGKVDYLTSLANIASARGDNKEEAQWRGQLYFAKKNPTNLDIYKWGIALYQSRNFEKADSVFSIYQEKYPDQIYGYLYRAKSNALMDSTMEEGLAVPFYTKLIEIAGKDTDKNKQILLPAYKYLAAYEANIKKHYTASLDYFDKLLQLDPGNEDAEKNTAVLKKWISEGKENELTE